MTDAQLLSAIRCSRATLRVCKRFDPYAHAGDKAITMAQRIAKSESEKLDHLETIARDRGLNTYAARPSQ